MKGINWYYNREELAEQYLKNIGMGPMPRMALLGVRRIGKTAFLLHDIAPKAIELGFLPVYINMWNNQEAPHECILVALNSYIHAVASKDDNSIKELLASEVRKLDINLGVIKASVDTERPATRTVETSQITEIAQLYKQLHTLTESNGKRLLMIMDEIQHLNTDEKFLNLQSCLRTQFDTFDSTCVIFAGSSRSTLSAMFNKDKVKINQRSVPMPFYNSAVLVDFPTLDDKYVDFCDDILRESFDLDYRRNELLKCFESLDKSPFWFRLLLSELTTNHIPVADAIDKIHSRIRLDQGLESIQKKMNMLDRLVFRRIHQEQELYSMQALDEYREQTGKKTQKGSVQRSVSKLVNWGVVTEMDNSYFVEKAGLYQLLFDQN